MLNSREIHLLRPDVAANCRVWLEQCRKVGLDVLITSTVRDEAYQLWLYGQGRTRPGKIVTNGKRPTFHGDKFGLAFDFCKNIRGHEYDDPDFFRRAAELAKEMGFSWGGDWRSFPDAPHIQWDNGGAYTGDMLLRGQVPPEMLRLQEACEMERCNTLAECPDWSRDTIRKLLRKGFLSGDGRGLDLSRDMLRLLVINDRAGVYGA